MMHFGIDYGSKLAGTTVVTWNEGKALLQESSSKKQDADQMILDMASDRRPTVIYLDAPLSLPLAYYGEGEDFFYRACDRKLKAMSPMFLGGLTARAMKLKKQLEKEDVEVIETYPGAMVRSLSDLAEVYSKKDKTIISSFCTRLQPHLADYRVDKEPTTLHHIDSLIAWCSGLRHQQGIAEIVGHRTEGQIIF